MMSASLSLSLPRLGWKSTSTPRSLKICTAAGESASEMRTLGLDMTMFLHALLLGGAAHGAGMDESDPIGGWAKRSVPTRTAKDHTVRSSPNPSLRGALATKQSRLSLRPWIASL